MCRGTPGLLIIALPADLRASIPELRPLPGQVNPPRLRLRGELHGGCSRSERRGEEGEVELRALRVSAAPQREAADGRLEQLPPLRT